MLRDPVPRIMSRRSSLIERNAEIISRDSGHITERVNLRAASGLKVRMIMRRPEILDSGASVKKRPVFVILGGYRTGDLAATLIPDTHGNIIVALAYPYDGDLGVKGLKVLPAVPSIRGAILDTPAAVMLALDYLLARDDVDPDRVEMVGASFGAPFGVVVAALDKRVTRVWSVYGAARPYDQLELNLRKAISFGPLRAVVAHAANIFASGPRLDPEQWVARVAPRQFIMINSVEDERIPRHAVDALYAAAQEPKEMIWLEGPHLHRSRPNVLSALVETVLRKSIE